MTDIFDSPALQVHRDMMERAREVADQQRMLARAAESQLSQASDAVEDLVADIEYFESLLTPDEEARVVIIGGPAGTMIFPHGLASVGMDRIRFDGQDQDGRKVAVIQHVSQLNVMLKAVRVGEEKARRIGFHVTDDPEAE